MALPRLADGGGERGHNLEHIPDDAVIGDLEDRRFAILVDRDDRARRAHPREMLHGAGDAERDVKIGAHDAPGLTDLIAVRTPSIVADRTRASDGRTTECAGQLFGLEIRIRFQAVM